MEVWRGGRGGWRLETVVFRLSQQKALENWCFNCVAGVYDKFWWWGVDAEWRQTSRSNIVPVETASGLVAGWCCC